MRALVQRVSRAVVHVDGASIGAIERGLCAFIGVGHDDDSNDARLLADRLTGLRVFEDADGKMNLSLPDVGGSLLVVSQFTLMADTRRGRRPSFTEAAPPDRARALIEELVARARTGPVPVATGAFGAHMMVDLCNDGPVTLMLDTKDASRQAS
jgi:D-tyrosyl-tRNA(Tyr) deacylase